MDPGLLIAIMLNTALVNNFVLQRFLGICPFMGVTRDIKNVIGMGFALIFVMFLASAVTWPIHKFLLVPYGLTFLQTLVFVLIIATLVQLTEIVLRRYLRFLYNSLGVYLPLMVTNCAILALTKTNISSQFTFIESLTNAVGAGLGFMIAMIIFSGIREHTESAEPPESFKGLPILFVSAAILSLAFSGFLGIFG
ncbi:MAG: electron transport complex subunit RsxA [Treponema sp.]|nr:electron transport complex subunit RsxA [Treponema sp.]